MAEWAKKNLQFDSSRIHWLGPLPEHQYHQVLACSDVHLYLTVPFVLSWSLLEAMAVGIPIVSCKTPPVLEVLEHNRNSLLSDFFDIEAIVSNIGAFLDNSKNLLCCQSSAQKDSERYSCSHAVLIGGNPSFNDGHFQEMHTMVPKTLGF